MSGKLVVVDTSVVILMVAPVPAGNEDRRRRQLRAETTLGDMRRDGVSFVVPAPVITELAIFSDGVGDRAGEIIAEVIFARFGGMRVEAFDLHAAETAGKMLRATFKQIRQQSDAPPRDSVKVDAMIAALAHELDAAHILTANPRDFRKHLDAVKSPVNVLNTNDPPMGQLRLLVDQKVPQATESAPKQPKSE
ncbi:MAG: PIN domain-containing protein [Myxococcales bacterium]|nr:PIN domain-containing protein [Myxococcales bacterium]